MVAKGDRTFRWREVVRTSPSAERRDLQRKPAGYGAEFCQVPAFVTVSLARHYVKRGGGLIRSTKTREQNVPGL